jgi:REP element-mobilizing transposase RayT
MPFCKSVKTHLRVESFLNLPISWDSTKMLVQVRANMSEFSNIFEVRVLEHFYNIKNPECPCCEMCLDEDLLHFVLKCPRYNINRNKYLDSYCLPLIEVDYIHLLKYPTRNSITDLCNQVKHALKLRNFGKKLNNNDPKIYHLNICIFMIV